jgi:hypothetical protein
MVCPFFFLFESCLCLWFVHSVSYPNGSCDSGLPILCLVSILPVSSACQFCVLSQYCLCLWFVHSVSCFNTACVSGLSILCLVPIPPVSLACPLCVLYTQNGQTRDRGSIETRHIMDKPETQAVLGQDREWTNQRHRQYWNKIQNGQTRDTGSIETRHKMDKPKKQAVLRQGTKWADQSHKNHWDKTMCVWLVHYVSYPNTACVSSLFILCLVSILHVSLLCRLCVLSQYYLCHWFVHYVSSLNTACVSGTCGIGIGHIMDQSDAHAALKQDTEWTNRRHRQYLDKIEWIDKP